MKPLHLLSTFLVLATPLSHAQERAAGSTLETQMTWSALSNQVGVVKSQINGVDSKVTVLDNRVSKLEVCAKRGRVYAPGAAGVDADGCLSTKIDTSHYDMTVACGDLQMIYDRSAQTCVKAQAPACRLEGKAGGIHSGSSAPGTGNIYCGPNRHSSDDTYQIFIPTSDGRSTGSAENYVRDGYCLRIVCN